MADAMEIAANKGMHALPPTRRIAPVVHAPGRGWPKLAASKRRDSRPSGSNSTALAMLDEDESAE